MTKIIGLTGGIGSGKTTIANYFNALGVPVYIADEQARIISDSPEIIASIKTVFGEKVLERNNLNREKLARIVFEDADELQKLNAIIHPAVKKDFEEWVRKHSNFPFIIKESAILFESGSYKDCDLIICVVAPLETRIERVMKRDGIDRETILKRINNQWTDAEKVKKSDFVIHNTDLLQSRIQVGEIFKKLAIT